MFGWIRCVALVVSRPLLQLAEKMKWINGISSCNNDNPRFRTITKVLKMEQYAPQYI